MASLITPHFPQVRFEPEDRKWFNPVMRTRAVDRPEERVRLRMIEFLVREAGFSTGRITTELPIASRRNSGPIRADILCFDELLRPLLLIECKSERVRLDESAAMQAARYNLSVKAPYIMLTNGVHDYLFSVQEDGGTRFSGHFGSVFPLNPEPVRSLSYWRERGMWGGVPDGYRTQFGSVGDSDEAIKFGSVGDSDEAAQFGSVGDSDEAIKFGSVGDSNETARNEDVEGAHLRIADFLHRFWRDRSFGEVIQYVAFRLPEIPEIPGSFARIYREESMHHAVAILGDATQKTWLVYGRVPVGGGSDAARGIMAPEFRTLELNHNRLNVLLRCSDIHGLLQAVEQM
jgi:hypothetical protein